MTSAIRWQSSSMTGGSSPRTTSWKKTATPSAVRGTSQAATSDSHDGEWEMTASLDLVSRCYQHIRQGILERRFLPGQTLSPAEIATEVGVSRTPVADALQRLENEGLVEIHPRRGTVVTRVTTRGVQEVADARTMIEVHAVPAAVANATPDDVARLHELLGNLERLLAADDERLTHAEWFRANAEFHRFIVALAGNEHILKMYDGLNLDLRLMRVVS